MIIVKINLGISLELLRAEWGQFSFTQFLVPTYTSFQGLQAPSSAWSMLTTGFQSVLPVTLRAVPCYLFILASSVCKSLQCLISTLTQGGEVATYLGSLVQQCCGEGGILQTNITGMCGECSQCTDHTGLPQLMVPALSLSTLLRLQVAWKGNFPKEALGCVHFPGLSCSGSGSP